MPRLPNGVRLHRGPALLQAPGGTDGLVFPTEIGTPLEPRNVLRRCELVAQRAGLHGVHSHTLRHSATSFLLPAETRTKVVQEHLGHSSYAITADSNSHVGPALQREAVDRLDEGGSGDRFCTPAALLYRSLYSCKSRAGLIGRPASDLRLCRADRT